MNEGEMPKLTSSIKKSGRIRYLATGRKKGRVIISDTNIQLFDKQEIIYKACFLYRFVFVQAGRRFGKTTLSKKVLMDKCLEKPGINIWYVAPYIKDAKELIGTYFDNLPKTFFRTRRSYQGYYEFKNGSKLWIKGSDRMDSLRGRGLDYVVMEEFSFHKRGVWEEIIRPQLADTKGGALFIGTPSVKRGLQYRQLSEYAKSGKDKEWCFYHFTIYDNPNINREEIEQIKNSTSDTVFKQEYLAEFVENEGFVYYEFDKNKNVFNPNVRFNNFEKYPAYEGIDWGLSDNTACVWVHVLPDKKVIVSKEYLEKNLPASQQAKNIISRRGNFNVELSVIDGYSFNRRDNDGFLTLNRAFRDNGFKKLFPSYMGEHVRNDSIMLIKKLLKGENDVPLLYISKNCKELINGLESWLYDEHEPDVLAALRIILYFLYRRNIIGNCNNIDLTKEHNNIDKLNISTDDFFKKKTTYQEINWNFDDGIPID